MLAAGRFAKLAGMFTLRQPRWLIAIAAVVAAAGVAAWAQIGVRAVPKTAGIKVVAVYPHDPKAFTQGLEFHAGKLYEGTGRYGESSLRLVDLSTGRVEKARSLNPIYFGEGIAILGDTIYQLTWQSGIALVYDLATFNVRETLKYEGEGWGLTDDGEHLIMSNGSATIRFLDPKTFKTEREIVVRDGDRPVDRLNELEYVDGEIWSNVWYDDRIARISPANGAILGWIDLSGLYPKAARSSDSVLNGIAFDADAKRLFVTGKDWPQLFEIEVVRP